MNDRGHGLTVTKGWLRTYVRCWHCDYRVPIGWRWEFDTVGSGLAYWEFLMTDTVPVCDRQRAAMPHCDSRVLHAPGECEHCDLYPEWQKVREMWRIAFTGHPTPDGGLPCPADAARPPDSDADHRRWPGNRRGEVPGQTQLFAMSEEEAARHAEAAEDVMRLERELRA